ncbi:DUF1559 family PulG-like putative transporter [Schlesneria paludicola]|uniref:DUF1559 family PulG-like putative transporter n=1 Tax=Schlesneria paludicola TaxID=360056 RepID=UPI0012F742D4|nr:DUF1559 domain-containing protein [Schlesneria paludicola]
MADERDSLTNQNQTNFDQQNKHQTSIRAGLLAIVSLAVILGLLWPVGGNNRGRGHRTICRNNVKQILLALLNYESIHHALPPAHTVDANDSPLHSWRTLILPMIGEQELYDSIDLSKPWDDPVNAIARKARVDTFRCPATACPENFTTYLAVVTPDSCLQDHEARHLAEIKQSYSQTVMILEVVSKNAVPWMSPQDAGEELLMGFGPKTVLPHQVGPTAGMLDGHVDSLMPTMPAPVRRKLISATIDDR